ncbi:hypothetical protein AiwAL_17685, partial [Acidiphilium sp. AL]|uniref:hypothetical protein n=1 Tax=Acidiphilium sp. AL TaxID=2871704 RepID=UPI0021CAEC1B
MSDYFSPTVVQPTIPNADMTPLERLLLTQVFDSEPDGDGVYFFAETSPCDQIELPLESVRMALAASDGVDSEAAAFVREQLKDLDDNTVHVQLDLSLTSWEFILQGIVRRSSTLDHVTVVSAFTCTKMRPDGSGGVAVLIAAGAILGKFTKDILVEFRMEKKFGVADGPPEAGD